MDLILWRHAEAEEDFELGATWRGA